MAKKADDLYREALALSEDEREELIRLLTIPTDSAWSSPEIEQAWMHECDRREQAIDRGEMDLIPTEEVHRRVREQLKG